MGFIFILHLIDNKIVLDNTCEITMQLLKVIEITLQVYEVNDLKGKSFCLGTFCLTISAMYL